MLHTQQEALHQLIRAALKEDIGEGDHSTLSSIPAQQEGKAVLRIKQAGIVAGIAVAESIFKLVEPNSVFTALKQDGDTMQVGEVAFEKTEHPGESSESAFAGPVAAGPCVQDCRAGRGLRWVKLL